MIFLLVSADKVNNYIIKKVIITWKKRSAQKAAGFVVEFYGNSRQTILLGTNLSMDKQKKYSKP